MTSTRSPATTSPVSAGPTAYASARPRPAARCEPPAVTGVTDVAVSFTKGCYPGQELVERMDSRGAAAPGALRVLTLGVEVPAGATPGDPVVDASGATIGTLTSVGSMHALATIKRGHTVGAAPAHVSATD